MTADAQALNDAFSSDGLRFQTGPGGFVRGVVTTPSCVGEFLLHGGQVTQWRPAGHDEVLWLSPDAVFEPTRPVRGGIPLCFPWFGPHPTRAGAPSHGLARTHEWSVYSVDTSGDAVDVTLEALIEGWACRFTASFGGDLVTTLQVRNRLPEQASFEAAFHSYFAIRDVGAVSIGGLEHAGYIDQTNADAPRPPEGQPVRLAGEADRIYLDRDGGPITIVDASERVIEITGTNARSAIVWNPGNEKAHAMPDLGDGWRQMVCVELGNVRDNRITVQPGQTFSMTSRVGVRGPSASE